MLQNHYSQNLGSLTRYTNGLETSRSNSEIAEYRQMSNVVTTVGRPPTPLIPNPHSYTVDEAVRWHGTALDSTRVFLKTGIMDTGFVDYVWSPENRPTLGVVPSINEVNNMALAKLTKRVNNSDLNLAVSLAEYKQVIDMLRGFSVSNIQAKGRDVIETIFNRQNPERPRTLARSNYAREVKRLQDLANRRSLQNSAELLADAHLQWKYGLKPFVSDLYSALDNLYRVELNRHRTIESVSYLPFPPAYYLNLDSPTYGTLNYKSRFEGRTLVKYSIKIDTTKIDQLAKWSSFNPLGIAWELMNKSFVLDWFIDVSQFISLIEAQSRNKAAFVNGTKTVMVAYDVESSCNTSDGRVSVQAKNRHIAYERTKLLTYPLPVLPTISFTLGASQMTSAVALLVQHFKTPLVHVPTKLYTGKTSLRRDYNWDWNLHS